MTFTQRLILEQIAPGMPFHAALVSFTGRSTVATPHRHDFAEMALILSGTGLHFVNSETLTLNEGDLLLIRPDDTHVMRARPGANLLFINIAFPVETWIAMAIAAGIEQEVSVWERSQMPPTVQVPDDMRLETAAAFQRALRAFHDAPTRLELCRFWASTLPHLVGLPSPAATISGPPWLSQACRAMRDDHNLRAGTRRMAILSGVSAAHLSRILKQQTGQTPTAFVNALRLSRAAILLTTTTRPIIAIADDCGFDNLSHFYRLFRRQYSLPPHAYRLKISQHVVP